MPGTQQEGHAARWKRRRSRRRPPPLETQRCPRCCRAPLQRPELDPEECGALQGLPAERIQLQRAGQRGAPLPPLPSPTTYKFPTGPALLLAQRRGLPRRARRANFSALSLHSERLLLPAVLQVARDGKGGGGVDVFLTTPGKANPPPVYPTAGTHLLPLKKVRAWGAAWPCRPPMLRFEALPKSLQIREQSQGSMPRAPTEQGSQGVLRSAAPNKVAKRAACRPPRGSLSRERLPPLLPACCAPQGEVVDIVLQNLDANANNGDYRGGEVGANRTAQEQHPFHLHGHHFWVGGWARRQGVPAPAPLPAPAPALAAQRRPGRQGAGLGVSQVAPRRLQVPFVGFCSVTCITHTLLLCMLPHTRLPSPWPFPYPCSCWGLGWVCTIRPPTPAASTPRTRRCATPPPCPRAAGRCCASRQTTRG